MSVTRTPPNASRIIAAPFTSSNAAELPVTRRSRRAASAGVGDRIPVLGHIAAGVGDGQEAPAGTEDPAGLADRVERPRYVVEHVPGGHYIKIHRPERKASGVGHQETDARQGVRPRVL